MQRGTLAARQAGAQHQYCSPRTTVETASPGMRDAATLPVERLRAISAALRQVVWGTSVLNLADEQKRREIGHKIEHRIEGAIFASRWILAPFYLGLAAGLLVLLIKFVQEFWHLAATAFKASEADVILGMLSLVDLAMTGSLLVIVIFAGYENFVSRIAHENHRDWPTWMGTIDFGALKLKLLSSIVAISAIQLLKDFMSISKLPVAGAGAVFDERRLLWAVVIHVVFVVSSLILAFSDKISGDHHGDPPAKPLTERARVDHGGTGAT
jgi:uncharacterized protein (TIGR00645 family)